MTERDRIFVFEYLTGGGLFLDGVVPASCHSLVTEGSAMRNALVEDLLAAGRTVTILSDERLVETLPDWKSQPMQLSVGSIASFHTSFAAALDACDNAWIIAPEIGGAHLDLTIRAEARCSLLSPNSTIVRLASDKQETAEFLRHAGIPTPSDTKSTGQYILKPNDGAGSLDIRLISVHKSDEWAELPIDDTLRIEQYIDGQAFSVSVLGSSSGFLVLEPCRQKLSGDGLFVYEGGQIPVESTDVRAILLETARRVSQAIPPWHGFLGMDVVIGAVGPVLIEINPRLTTSYVGLRSWYDQNLAKIVLDSKHEATESLSARKFQLQFDPYGRVNKDDRVNKDGRASCLLKYDWQSWQ
jgi:tyramine---L-glutamate ligase